MPGALKGQKRAAGTATQAVSVVKSTSSAAVLKSAAEAFAVLAAGAVISSDEMEVSPEHSYRKVFPKHGSELHIIPEILSEETLEGNVCSSLSE